MNRILRAGTISLAALACLTLVPTSEAGLKDKLKGKLKEKVEQKVEQKTEGVIGEADPTATDSEEASSEKAMAPATTVAEVNTKFDFVPGSKLILYDDFTEDELGEFPHKWKLHTGTVEIAESGGERWLRAAESDGRIRMKVPAGLPEKWTLEFDVMVQPGAWAYTVSGMNGNQSAWIVTFPQVGNTVTFQSGALNAQTAFAGGRDMTGRHHVMLMGKGLSLKVYIDQQRVVNVPEVAVEVGRPEEIELCVRHVEYDAMITNVRFAEGGKTTADFLDEGKLVTYGIHFDTGSDVVKPESAPVLREIAAYMKKNDSAKLTVVGHTDNQGNAKNNLDLSKRRAGAVAKALAELGIAVDRLATDGKGDTEPVAENDQAEGRAANRRVEFTRA